MSQYKNARKVAFLAGLDRPSIEADTDTLTKRCKFNFSYFDVQAASQSFEGWTQDQLSKLLHKLKDYSRESLKHWCNTSLGKSGKVLVVYGAFPAKTDFLVPKHVPHQAQWARFRLESAVRLVGFVLPKEYHAKEHPKTGERYDCNTFYVVFLDAEHRFYKVEVK